MNVLFPPKHVFCSGLSDTVYSRHLSTSAEHLSKGKPGAHPQSHRPVCQSDGKPSTSYFKGLTLHVAFEI